MTLHASWKLGKLARERQHIAELYSQVVTETMKEISV